MTHVKRVCVILPLGFNLSACKSGAELRQALQSTQSGAASTATLRPRGPSRNLSARLSRVMA